MKFTVKEERQVRSLKDIQIIKSELSKKSQQKKQIISNRIDYIAINSSLQDVYVEVLEKFNLQHSLMNMLPMLLKYKELILNSKVVSNAKEKVKQPKFIFWTTTVATLSSLLYFKIRKQNKSTQL